MEVMVLAVAVPDAAIAAIGRKGPTIPRPGPSGKEVGSGSSPRGRGGPRACMVLHRGLGGGQPLVVLELGKRILSTDLEVAGPDALDTEDAGRTAEPTDLFGRNIRAEGRS